jgi:hypothetical protein
MGNKHLKSCPFCGFNNSHKDNCYFTLISKGKDYENSYSQEIILTEAWNRRYEKEWNDEEMSDFLNAGADACGIPRKILNTIDNDKTMKTTIKEVYEQCLANGWLGSEKCDIKIEGKAARTIGPYIEEGVGFIVAMVKGVIGPYRDYTQVEWTGNQPEKKMLYAALCWKDHHINEEAREVRVAENIKAEFEKGRLFIKWLDEDRYPPEPIEIEGEG